MTNNLNNDISENENSENFNDTDLNNASQNKVNDIELDPNSTVDQTLSNKDELDLSTHDGQNMVDEETETCTVEKKSFFCSKKFYAIVGAATFVLIVVISCFIIFGSSMSSPKATLKKFEKGLQNLDPIKMVECLDVSANKKIQLVDEFNKYVINTEFAALGAQFLKEIKLELLSVTPIDENSSIGLVKIDFDDNNIKGLMALSGAISNDNLVKKIKFVKKDNKWFMEKDSISNLNFN